MDEKALILKAKKGDLEAFEQLVLLYEKRVYAVAFRSSGTPEDAADITQETFLRIWRSIETFRGDSGFSTWVFRIAMNLCVDLARKKNTGISAVSLTEEDDKMREVPDTAPTPEEHFENEELGKEIALGLSQLSEEHRQTILLRDVTGLSYTEIAETLDISEGTVKSRLSRARFSLREILRKRGNIMGSASSNQMKGGGNT